MAITINPVKINNISRINNRNTVSFRERNQEEPIEKDKSMLPAVLLTTASIGLGIWGYLKIKKRNVAFIDSNAAAFEEAKVYLKNIFNKDFTLDETKLYVQKYKELNNISDNKDFCQKLFEQLKKDFNIENKSLNLEISDSQIKECEGGVFTGYAEALSRKIGILAQEDRTKMVGTIFHEMRHIKQNELMYKADKERLVVQKIKELEDSNNASWQEILQNFAGDKNKARNAVREEVERVYQEIWGHLKPTNKTSEEYKLGIKYLENEENRIKPGPDYYEQILEKEAQFIGNNAEKLFELFKK